MNDTAILERFELDQQIATLRYGYTEYHVSELSRLLYGRVSPQTCWDVVPQYSTDADAALTLADDFPGFTLCYRGGLPEDKRWYAAFKVYAYAPTPELAICRAWLATDKATP